MQNPHTPGPWVWREDPTSPGYFLVRGKGKNICIMQQRNSDMGMADDPKRSEAIANARLIAASPELAELVRAFVAETVDYATRNKLGDPEQQHNVKWARAVLAKVDGSQQQDIS